MDLEHPLKLEQQLCFSLYSTSLAMTQLYKPLLEPLGLTYPQYLVMLILWQQDGIGLKDIAQQLGQKPGALTPVIKRLEQDGVVIRSRRPDDERALAIFLSEKGKALKLPAAKVGECVAEACGMPLQELIQLRETLIKLRHNLQR